MPPDSTNDRLARLSERIRELEKMIHSHLATCTERAKVIDYMLQEVEVLKELTDKWRGGWIGLSIVCVVVMNVLQMVIIMLKL